MVDVGKSGQVANRGANPPGFVGKSVYVALQCPFQSRSHAGSAVRGLSFLRLLPSEPARRVRFDHAKSYRVSRSRQPGKGAERGASRGRGLRACVNGGDDGRTTIVHLMWRKS
jgi:hypothetical protein